MWPDGEDDEVGRGVVGAEAAERGAADEAARARRGASR